MSKKWGVKRIDIYIDPSESEHGPVRTLKDMTEDEILEIERKYGMPVRRPNRE